MTKEAQKTRGRKPVKDKKIRLILFVEESKIKKLRGEDKVKALCYDHIDETIAEL